MMKNLTFALLTVAAGLLGTTSCSEADKIFDCQTVCSRYQSCFDSKYDVSACRNRCKSKADADKEYQRKADACEACIDERSCTEATFKCAAPCAGIIP